MTYLNISMETICFNSEVHIGNKTKFQQSSVDSKSNHLCRYINNTNTQESFALFTFYACFTLNTRPPGLDIHREWSSFGKSCTSSSCYSSPLLFQDTNSTWWGLHKKASKRSSNLMSVYIKLTIQSSSFYNSFFLGSCFMFELNIPSRDVAWFRQRLAH